MVSQADKDIAAQVPSTPGGTRGRSKANKDIAAQVEKATTGNDADDGPVAEAKQPITPRSAKVKGFSHADSEIATQLPTSPGRTRAEARKAAANAQQIGTPTAAAPQGSSSASSGPSSKRAQASEDSSSGAQAPSAAPAGQGPSESAASSPGALSQPVSENQAQAAAPPQDSSSALPEPLSKGAQASENSSSGAQAPSAAPAGQRPSESAASSPGAQGERNAKETERRRPSPNSVGAPSLPDMPNRSETSAAPSKESSQTRASESSLGSLARGIRNLRIELPGKKDASRPEAKLSSNVSMRDPSAGPSDVSMPDAPSKSATPKSERSGSETPKYSEEEQWHDAEESQPSQKHGRGQDQAQIKQAQGDTAHPGPQDKSNSDSDSDDDERFVDFEDPETRDQFGNFTTLKALIVGALAWRGRMIVQLPSNNPRYSGFPRYYTVICGHYGVQWKSLQRIAHRDLPGLKSLKERGVSKPKVLGASSTPVYVKEPQTNPFQHVRLDLPRGTSKWHSKSDAEAVWGGYEKRMQKYWNKAGQTCPKKPRPVKERTRLQELAVDYLQAETRGKSPAREGLRAGHERRTKE